MPTPRDAAAADFDVTVVEDLPGAIDFLAAAPARPVADPLGPAPKPPSMLSLARAAEEAEDQPLDAPAQAVVALEAGPASTAARVAELGAATAVAAARVSELTVQLEQAQHMQQARAHSSHPSQPSVHARARLRRFDRLGCGVFLGRWRPREKPHA